MAESGKAVAVLRPVVAWPVIVYEKHDGKANGEMLYAAPVRIVKGTIKAAKVVAYRLAVKEATKNGRPAGDAVPVRESDGGKEYRVWHDDGLYHHVWAVRLVEFS